MVIKLIKFTKMICVLIIFVDSAAAQEERTLESFLDQVTSTSENIEALKLRNESLVSEIKARDFELVPRFNAELSQTENRLAAQSTGSQRPFSRLFDLNLSKLMATGTTLSMSSGYERLKLPSFTDGPREVVNWEVTFFQSLVRNSFGRATRLRREHDQYELKSRYYGLVFQRQQTIQNLENLYWDLALSYKEITIREENLKRSENLEKWIRVRINKSAAEPTDLLKMQSLVSSRRLELIASKGQVEAIWNQIRQLLPNISQSWIPDQVEFETPRRAEDLVYQPNSVSITEPIRLDWLVLDFRAKQAEKQYKRVEDSLRPSLDVFVSHGRNGADPRFSDAWRRSLTEDSTSSKFGILFSWELDGDLRNERKSAARLEASALQLEANRLKRDSDIGWKELKRRLDQLYVQSQEARTLANIQKKNSEAERRRYEQGRTTAFEVITFEISAAESALQYYRTLATLRKTENLSRLFTFPGAI